MASSERTGVKNEEFTIVANIKYRKFENNLGPALQVIDLDSGEIVTTVNFKTDAKAGEVYDEAVRVAKLTS